MGRPRGDSHRRIVNTSTSTRLTLLRVVPGAIFASRVPLAECLLWQKFVHGIPKKTWPSKGSACVSGGSAGGVSPSPRLPCVPHHAVLGRIGSRRVGADTPRTPNTSGSMAGRVAVSRACRFPPPHSEHISAESPVLMTQRGVARRGDGETGRRGDPYDTGLRRVCRRVAAGLFAIAIDERHTVHRRRALPGRNRGARRRRRAGWRRTRSGGWTCAGLGRGVHTEA